MQLNPNAYFDTLSVGIKLQNALVDLAHQEVHLFCYLACLLSLYAGEPVGNWGYLFAVTEHGYPYSAALDDAIRTVTEMSLVEEVASSEAAYIRVTPLGAQECESLLNLGEFRRREVFIEGACSSLLALPVGGIRTALSNGVGVKGSVALKQARLLLSEPDLDLLYEQFSILSQAVGVTVSDLMVPAVVWLSYLSNVMPSGYVKGS